MRGDYKTAFLKCSNKSLQMILLTVFVDLSPWVWVETGRLWKIFAICE